MPSTNPTSQIPRPAVRPAAAPAAVPVAGATTVAYAAARFVRPPNAAAPIALSSVATLEARARQVITSANTTVQQAAAVHAQKQTHLRFLSDPTNDPQVIATAARVLIRNEEAIATVVVNTEHAISHFTEVLNAIFDIDAQWNPEEGKHRSWFEDCDKHREERAKLYALFASTAHATSSDSYYEKSLFIKYALATFISTDQKAYLIKDLSRNTGTLVGSRHNHHHNWINMFYLMNPNNKRFFYCPYDMSEKKTEDEKKADFVDFMYSRLEPYAKKQGLHAIIMQHVEIEKRVNPAAARAVAPA